MLLLWYDYGIFIFMLGVSTAVGIYFGCFRTKLNTVSEYLLGGRKMSAVPIAFSVAVGHFSAITLMVLPSDVYKYGAFYWFSCISMTLMVIITVYIYYPVLFSLQITSVYEYLEKRFDKKTKLLISFLYIVSEIIYLAISAYTPSLAISTATGLGVFITSTTICGICIFYTTIGGLRTVVWTDIFQFLLVIVSLLTVCCVGFKAEKGFSNVWKKSLEGGRLDIFDFDLDPTKRDTFWTFVIGFTAHFSNYITLSQSGIQKFLCLPTFSDCVRSLIYVGTCMSAIATFVVLIGLLLYSHYSGCDPIISQKIHRHEQLVPYYIMEVAGNIPGVFGCFLVAMFSAALSTISSSLNALAGVIYKDFIAKFLKNDMSEARITVILKIIVAVSGCVSICLMLLIPYLGDIVPLVTSLVAIYHGPSLGVFTLGLLFPQANANGAFYGAIGGSIFTSFMALPMKFYLAKGFFSYLHKSLSTEFCDDYNSTYFSDRYYNTTHSVQNEPFFIFRISHYNQTFFGAIFTLILGLIISYATKSENVVVDRSLISPVSHFLLPKIPRNQVQEMDSLVNGNS